LYQFEFEGPVHLDGRRRWVTAVWDVTRGGWFELGNVEDEVDQSEVFWQVYEIGVRAHSFSYWEWAKVTF